MLDGAAIVHLLPTTNATTFEGYANATFIPHMNQNLRTCKHVEDYANATFIPHMNQNLHTCKHVDVVLDTYISNSINEKKRGKGIRTKVESGNKFPSNWSDFIWDCMNKQELIVFLTNKMASTEWPEGKQLLPQQVFL